MGYRVHNIFSVSPNDNHAYFFYYVPTMSFEFLWINEWLLKNFSRIAQLVGPDGVIIAPSKFETEEYILSLLEIKKAKINYSESIESIRNVSIESFMEDVEYFENAFSDRSLNKKQDRTDSILEAPFPFLIISRYPLTKKSNHKAIILNMAAFKDEKSMGKAFDSLMKIIRDDEWSFLEDINPGKRLKIPRSWDFVLNDAIELKPNIFGVGINFNYILEKLAALILKDKRKSEQGSD